MIINRDNNIGFLFSVAERHVPNSPKKSSIVCKLKRSMFQEREIVKQEIEDIATQSLGFLNLGDGVPGLSLFCSLCFCVFENTHFFFLLKKLSQRAL